MNLPKLEILKIVAIVAVSSIIPGLALSGTLLGTDKGKGNDGHNNGNQRGKTDNGTGIQSFRVF
jgi:hypothetical protein